MILKTYIIHGLYMVYNRDYTGEVVVMLGIDGVIIGAICVGIPICVYAILKDCKHEANEKEEQYTKEQLELIKLQIELEKLKSQNATSTNNATTNVKGMF